MCAVHHAHLPQELKEALMRQGGGCALTDEEAASIIADFDRARAGLERSLARDRRGASPISERWTERAGSGRCGKKVRSLCRA